MTARIHYFAAITFQYNRQPGTKKYTLSLHIFPAYHARRVSPETKTALNFLTQTVAERRQGCGELSCQFDAHGSDKLEHCYFDIRTDPTRNDENMADIILETGYLCITNEHYSPLHVFLLFDMAHRDWSVAWERNQVTPDTHVQTQKRILKTMVLMMSLTRLPTPHPDPEFETLYPPRNFYGNIRGIMIKDDERIEDLLQRNHLLNEFTCRMFLLL
jgi:hypothetical protein